MLGRLRAAVRERRPGTRLGGGGVASEASDLRGALYQMQQRQAVNPHLPIAWPTWPPGVVPKLVAVAQKLTRRLLAWYINPIVAQQNDFNRAAVQTAEAMRQTIAALTAENADLQARVAALEARGGARMAAAETAERDADDGAGASDAATE